MQPNSNLIKSYSQRLAQARQWLDEYGPENCELESSSLNQSLYKEKLREYQKLACEAGKLGISEYPAETQSIKVYFSWQDKNSNWFDCRHFLGTQGFKQLQPKEPLPASYKSKPFEIKELSIYKLKMQEKQELGILPLDIFWTEKFITETRSRINDILHGYFYVQGVKYRASQQLSDLSLSCQAGIQLCPAPIGKDHLLFRTRLGLALKR